MPKVSARCWLLVVLITELTQKVLGGTIWDLPNYQGQLEEAMPSPEQFYTEHASGFGRPFIMRGYAKRMPAFSKWATDESLKNLYGREMLQNVEYAKKETRAADTKSSSIAKFLGHYNTTDCYAVSSVPKRMAGDVFLPRFLNCGYASSYLDVNNIWFSSGETKSVIHNDDQDNLNCVFTGTKRMIFFSPTNKTSVESPELGWMIADEEAEKDPDYQGYGAYNGKMDVDDFDLKQYPGWAKLPWWDAQLAPGDCVFIPTSWYHHVHSKGRSLAVNSWWWRRDSLEGLDWNCQAKESEISFADCKWGYDGPPDQPGTKANPRKLTRCKGASSRTTAHADSFITQWQRFPERVLIPKLQKKLGYSVGAPVETMIELMNEFHDRKKNRKTGRGEEL